MPQRQRQRVLARALTSSLKDVLVGESRVGPEGVWMSSSSTAEKVRPWRGRGSRQESRPGFAPHKGDPLPCSLSQRGGPPGQKPGSQLEARRLPRTRGGGAGGVLLLQTQSGLSEAINSPGPSPQSSGQSLGKMENHRACKDPISLLWVKHCSSSFSVADITRRPFYKCRGPWEK